MSSADLEVTYMEATTPPTAAPAHEGPGSERIALERLSCADYLDLYRCVGAPLRWDQRLQMPEAELDALLGSPKSRVYVLRDRHGEALGFCEFDRSGFPEVELKNFGLVPEAQGRGLGPWLLSHALTSEWQARPRRIWLHTDPWDHPAAIPTYERAGFRTYAVRMEPAASL